MTKIHNQMKAIVKTFSQLARQIDSLNKMIIELEKKESKKIGSKKTSSRKIKQRILIPKPAKKVAVKK